MLIMNLVVPILAGIAVAGIIQQAAAVPAPFKVTAVPQQANGESYTTLAARMGKDFIAALIPYRVFKNGAVTYHLGGKETPPLQVWAVSYTHLRAHET